MPPVHPGRLLAAWRETATDYRRPRHSAQPLCRHQAGTVAARAGLSLALYTRLEAGDLPAELSRVLVERVAASVPAFRHWLELVAARHDARRHAAADRVAKSSSGLV